jgi:hypothetical protein
LAPSELASGDRRLPPILHKLSQNSMPSCSKGARGLSVLVRVHGIFTATTISPSPWSRQWGNRYAIRAGRNLPDKEFRYLRTVIVTAAVYRRFGSELLRANPNCNPSELEEQVLSPTGAHLLPKLRCYFAEFLNQGSLERLRIFSSPTCVGLQYDHLMNYLEAFLGSVGSTSL